MVRAFRLIRLFDGPSRLRRVSLCSLNARGFSASQLACVAALRRGSLAGYGFAAIVLASATAIRRVRT
jgi:hypothetical protein